MAECFSAAVHIEVVQGFWQVSFDSIIVNGKSFLGTTTAIIDTGTSLADVTGDTDTVRAFYENIPGSAEVGDGTWTCTFSRIARMLLNRSPYNDISPLRHQCDCVHNIWRYRVHNVSGHFQRWLL